MDTQPPPQEQPTYAPSPWRARWYRIKRLCSWVIRRGPRFDVNQALKEQRFQVWRDAREHYLGCCPEHPEDGPMLDLQHGHYRCGTCWARDYFRSLDAGPVTDPQQHLQTTIPQQRPLHAYRQAVKDGAGTSTATLAAIPKWLVRLREKPRGSNE